MLTKEKEKRKNMIHSQKLNKTNKQTNKTKNKKLNRTKVYVRNWR